MHHDELWQLFDKNGTPLMNGGYDSSLDNPTPESGLTYGVVVIWLFRQAADGVELLWQKRAPGVSHYANFWDISAGGHINYGETNLEAAEREAREEIGAKVTSSDLQYVCSSMRNLNSVYWCYAVDWTGRTEPFSFSDQEVSEVKWVPLSELDDFRQSCAKPPLRKDIIHFEVLKDWFKKRYGN